MSAFPPEAPWVTDMRDHFHQHGFYRREDLERLLGKPGDSVQITLNGDVVYRTAQVDTDRMAETGTGSVRRIGSAVGDSRCARRSGQ